VTPRAAQWLSALTHALHRSFQAGGQQNGAPAAGPKGIAMVGEAKELSMAELAGRPVFWAYAVLNLALASLVVVFIALAANSANNCVWINGVCFDRPFGGYA
jgi:hypothetical protein